MSYQIQMEADFKCPKGHEFVAEPNYEAYKKPLDVLCPICYADFIEANVPKGVQIGEARAKPITQFIPM